MAMAGLFSSKELFNKPSMAVVPRCGQCGLYKGCNSPKMQVTGDGRLGILVVGEAPGKVEDQEGEQFVGESGDLLRGVLAGLGIDLDKDCWKTNAIICRPPNNETPTSKQTGHCLPNLTTTIKKLNPTTILALGKTATQAVVMPFWQDVGAIGRWAGWQIPSTHYNAWVCPTWHPAYILRTRRAANGKPDPASLWWGRHVEAATTLPERPHKRPPKYEERVMVIHDPDKAAYYIRKGTAIGGLSAFDLETNALKPEVKGARIYSCAVCFGGRKTVSYPWHGEAIRATREYLRAPIKKIASNMKFEDRWVRSHLNTKVRGWLWDTMLAAHIDDNRPGISGLKFQALILLGQGEYNTHIEGYLSSVGIGGLNKITEADLNEVLIYNGLDSLLEYEIAIKQRRAMQ